MEMVGNDNGSMKDRLFELYFQRHYSWIVPDKDAISMIKKYTNSILEIGAGTGLWAKLLQNNNIEVIATDLMDEKYTEYYKKSWTDVEKMDCVEAVKKYRDVESLMLIWPHPESMFSFIEAMREFRGDKVIIVTLEKYENKEWELVESKPLTNLDWSDPPHLHLLKRKL